MPKIKPAKLKLFGRKVFVTPQLAIVVGVVTLGAWYFIANSLAANNYTVRFVLFCVDKCSNSTTTLDKYAKEVQSYYQKQLGKTFTLEKTTSFVATKTLKEYLCYKNTSCSNQLLSVHNYIQSSSLNSATKKTVAYLDFRAGNTYCGYGGGSIATINRGASGCSNPGAVMAHELGHVYGLGHTTDSSNIMYAQCLYTKGYGCSFNSSQKSSIQKSPWFGGSTGGSISGSGGSVKCPGALGDKTKAHPLTKEGDKTECTKHVQYMLNKIYAWRVAAKTSLGGLIPQSVNGAFGGITKNNVKAYQKTKGLSATGVVDTATWDAIHTSCAYVNSHPKGSIKC